jgi:hypothetical protein
MTWLQNSLLELTMAWHDPGEASRRALIATKLIEIGFNSSLLNARDYASFVCWREDLHAQCAAYFCNGNDEPSGLS